MVEKLLRLSLKKNQPNPKSLFSSQIIPFPNQCKLNFAEATGILYFSTWSFGRCSFPKLPCFLQWPQLSFILQAQALTGTHYWAGESYSCTDKCDLSPNSVSSWSHDTIVSHCYYSAFKGKDSVLGQNQDENHDIRRLHTLLLLLC